MALSDDITNLPASPASGATSHLTNHAVIHAALKAHEARFDVNDTNLTKKADLIGGRIDPAQLIGTGATGSGIRVDTTVGTRVFVGTTMIYGDTGWRDISADMINNWTGQIWVRRRGNDVTLVAQGVSGGSPSNMLNLQSGFRTPIFGRSGLNYGSPYPMADGSSPTNILGGYLVVAGGGHILRAYLESGVASLLGDASWTTNDSWPSSLPGTPA